MPGNERGFSWLIEKLLPPSDQIKGCELLFPETVFFEQGKPKSLIKSDKDQILVATSEKYKLTKDALMKTFVQVQVDQKKKYPDGIFKHKYGEKFKNHQN